MTTTDAKTRMNGVKEPIQPDDPLVTELTPKETKFLLNGSHPPADKLTVNGVCDATDDGVTTNGFLNGHSDSSHSTDTSTDAIPGETASSDCVANGDGEQNRLNAVLDQLSLSDADCDSNGCVQDISSQLNSALQVHNLLDHLAENSNTPPIPTTTNDEASSSLITGASAVSYFDRDGENLISTDGQGDVEICPYSDEGDLPGIIGLITKDLSEPYSIYTYRYFIHNWPQLCFKARLKSAPDVFVGAIVCKLDIHRVARRGYIAMLAVHSDYRRHKIGRTLVRYAIVSMIAQGCDEVVLETEVTNKAAMKLYEQFGFVRDKRLHRYYLNGVDAFRLKLWLS